MIKEYQLPDGNIIYHRDNTNDHKPIKEIFNGAYRLSKVIGEGQTVLDLGAHIGGFTRFCNLKGANVIAFEPDKENFEILTQNSELAQDGIENELYNACVTTDDSDTLTFFFNDKKPEDRYRFTKIQSPGRKGTITVDNINIDVINEMVSQGLHIDFLKMDIEGSEFSIIDEGKIPLCDNLAMEYHFTKDGCMKTFRKRIAILKKQFKHVWTSSDNNLLTPNKLPNDTYTFWMDHFVFASNLYSKEDLKNYGK